MANNRQVRLLGYKKALEPLEFGQVTQCPSQEEVICFSFLNKHLVTLDPKSLLYRKTKGVGQAQVRYPGITKRPLNRKREAHASDVSVRLIIFVEF